MDGPKSLEYYLKIFQGKHLPPSLSRCPRREHRLMKDYINSWPPYWKQIVENLALKLPRIKSTIRIVGLIPARNEQYRILGCIDAIISDVKTSGMENLFELIILENGISEEIGYLDNIIMEWKKNHKSSLLIHILKQTWNLSEKYPIAKARKILADIAIYRINKANLKYPTYLLSEDADIESIQTYRLKAGLSKMDNNPTIDAIRGTQERSIRVMKENHLVLIERRSWQITELLLSSHQLWPQNNKNFNFYWNRVVTAGSNVFFSAEVYCLIGGYTEDIAVFEDMDIGQRISVLRGRYCNNEFIPRMDTVLRFPWREESSIARVLFALSKRDHLYNHDGSSFFNTDNFIKSPDAIQNLLYELKPYSRVENRNIYRFEQVLTDLYLEIQRILKDNYLSKMLFIRMMYFLGLSKDCYLLLANDCVILKNIPYFQDLLSSFLRIKAP